MYRFLGIFWVLVGINLLVLPYFFPELRDHPTMEHNVPLAGFCFMISAYNMIRWRLIRAREIERENERELELRRRERNRPIDPTFDFSDSPKPPDGNAKKPNP